MNWLMDTYFVYVFSVLFLMTNCQQYSDDKSNNSPIMYETVQTQRHKVGANLILKCDHSNVPILWEFQACSVSYKGIRCNEKGIHDLNNDDKAWTKINNSSNKLNILNATFNNSGIYRCSNNYRILNIYIVEIVDLLIKDPPKIISIHASNTTVAESTYVTLQCTINSTITPEVFWFKQCNDGTCEVEDNGICHCLIARPPYSNPSENIYYSKIIIKAQKSDSRVYSCIAITESGKDCENITIRVLSSESSQKSLFLLFFIPVILILIPVIIWLCYFKKKTKKVEIKFKQPFEIPLV